MHDDGHRPRRGTTEWPDAQLIEAVRGDPPDDAALQALVDRYWKALYARCRLLTQSTDLASDLAQESWYRVLRARRTLQPDKNFAAYLITIATNLWRDRNRSERRAGPLARHRVVSLDTASSDDAGDATTLADALPDPYALGAEEQLRLRVDIDYALGQLSPELRDVLLARYFDGESAAEIGARYGRTEQTITSWLRRAVAQMRAALATPRGGRASETPGASEHRPPLRGDSVLGTRP